MGKRDPTVGRGMGKRDTTRGMGSGREIPQEEGRWVREIPQKDGDGEGRSHRRRGEGEERSHRRKGDGVFQHAGELGETGWCWTQDGEFVECLRDAFVEQLVREPTRVKAILDLVLCHEPDLISDLEVKEPLGGSDHNMICFYLQFEKDKGSSEVSVLQLNSGNYGAMREELAKVHRTDIPAEKTMEQQWQFEKDKGSSEVSVLQLNRGNYGAMREELAKVDWTDIPAEETMEQQ
ncbi:uncharacterized protein LOC132387717 isoform X1 [Hypanus sabinus]|uniref:uncharacterized protein LOC132387717 isoform X1 n=1 Tax=Hypanus sabinus TaxID=79690 RepID=UPI0028C3E6B3|nr:uncharacterized protein LOC132387717 isoform X1 [Hypanus sabinus]